MDTETYTALQREVKTAARTVGREWADVIDTEDAEQEIWVRLLESKKTMDELAVSEEAVRMSAINEIGHQIGMKYRDDYELFSGNATYGTKEVRTMLDEGMISADITEINLKNPDAHQDLLLGMTRLHKRNARYWFLVTEKYVNHVDFANDDPDRKALDRAVDALTREMNGSHRKKMAEFHDGPGARTAMSNERSIRGTRNTYTDDGIHL